MKCLHICNDFSNTKVHKNLFSHLDELGLEQIIYNPVRQNTPIGNNAIDFKSSDSKIIYSSKLKKYHRIFFRDKINHLFKDLNFKCDLSKIDVIHASTLYSDGALAYKIFKKYKTPYIVAVRGTDVNAFLKYRPDLFFILKEILKNASEIVYLSNSIKDQFQKKKYVQLTNIQITDKSKVISNGIDNFWLSNITAKKELKNPFKILYVGRFDKNKNTIKLINAVLELKKEYPNLEIDLVGKDGANEEQVIGLSKSHKGVIKFRGPIYDKKELRKIFISNHIFTMPSHSETFGLVYLEALSQGLPILCSKNQGIDRSFIFKIGEFADSNSLKSIIDSLRSIIKNYNSYQIDNIDFTAFQWKETANTYYNIYKSICTL